MSLLEHLNLTGAGRSELTPALFERLRRFIYEQTGIYFQDNKRYLLESRLSRRVQRLGMPSFEAYAQAIMSGRARDELTELVNAVTINETFFFRNTAQLDVLEAHVLPEAAERRQARGQRTVRIWSAACSTGEEPYSVALLVHDTIAPRFPRVQFEIIGTDINTDVVRAAQEGLYGAYATRNVPPATLRKHFRPEGDSHRLSPTIRQRVQFRQLNLVDRVGMLRMRDVDVILCANVLIYFDPDSKKRVVSHLYNSLTGGGHLFVGFSETLYGVTQALKPVRYEKTIAYKKEAAPAAAAPFAFATAPSRA